MITISVCIIACNEDRVLARCLQGAALFADELIVLDTGSDDATKEIARRYTHKVYDYNWTDDFAAARNASFAKATCDYIMWLDADDVVDKANASKISALKEQLSEENTVVMPYSRPENGGQFDYIRIVRRRENATYWQGIVHERLTAYAPIGRSDAVILHAKSTPPCYQRNIKLMESLSPDTLQQDFWLCSQCYLDCCLAGEWQKADVYFDFLRGNTADFSEKVDSYLLIAHVLFYHKVDIHMIAWTQLAWQDYSNARASQLCFKKSMRALLFFAIKAAKRLGQMKQAEQLNRRVLQIEPENTAAKINQIYFCRRKGQA